MFDVSFNTCLLNAGYRFLRNELRRRSRTCTHTGSHTQTCTQTRTHTRTRTRICTRTRTCALARTRIHKYVHVHTGKRTRTRIYVHLHVHAYSNMYTCTRTHIHAHVKMHVKAQDPRPKARDSEPGTQGRYLHNRIASPGGLLRAVGSEPVLAQCGTTHIINNFPNIINVCCFILINMCHLAFACSMRSIYFYEMNCGGVLSIISF